MNNSLKLSVILLGITFCCVWLFFLIILNPFYQHHLILKQEEKMMISMAHSVDKVPQELQTRQNQLYMMRQNLHVISDIDQLKRDLEIYKLSIVSIRQQRDETQVILFYDNPQNFLHFLQAQMQNSRYLSIESLIMEPAQVSLLLRSE